MRAAGCYGVSAVRYTGERFNRATKFYTDTKSSHSKIPLSNLDDLLSDLPSSYAVVCVELVIGATALPEFTHPENALYIFGPEDGSVSQGLIDQADHIVYVPTIGCMNLAASVNVLLYDRLSKSANISKGDTLIIQSRDQKNRLIVKA
jgi:tRNA(Leu) C34 or U34 (ribose-2'-O)-methylase TrmL